MAYPKRGTQEYEEWILTPEYEEHCKKCSEVNTGKQYTEEWLEWASNRMTGEKNPNFGGVYCTEEWRKLHSEKMTGKTSEEHSKRMSGEGNPMYGLRGENHPAHGRKHTEEELEKMSERALGENHPNWRGGTTNDPYAKIFNERNKKINRLLYENVCFKCGMTREENGQELDVHHYDYNKNSENWVPLCHGCNSDVNHDREYWKEYFTVKVELYWVMKVLMLEETKDISSIATNTSGDV